MSNWKDIEGFLTEESSKTIEPYIKNVPEDGWIIEIGCFKGKQSRFIATTKRESVLLSCLDPFPDNLINFDDSRTYKNYEFADWVKNTSDFKNIEAVKGISPLNISNICFNKIPNLIIFDIDNVLESLIFWHAHINRNTYLILHTYINEHDKIAKQAEIFATQYGYKYQLEKNVAILKR